MCVNKLFYSLSGPGGWRGERWGGAVGTQRERERGRWSQYSGMRLGKPRVDTAQMTVRESLADAGGGTRSTPPALTLPPSLLCSLSLSFPSRLPCPFTQSVFVSCPRAAAASLSAIKNIIQPGRHSNGETGLCQTGGAWKTAEPTSPHFCCCCRCCWQSAAKSPLWLCPTWTLKSLQTAS